MIMRMTKNKRKKNDLFQKNALDYLKIASILFFALLVGTYFAFKFERVAEGPKIAIESPQNFESVYQDSIEVSGTLKNIAGAEMNGKKIFINENDKFKEKLLLYPGYNVIKIRVWDRFGEEREREIKIYRN